MLLYIKKKLPIYYNRFDYLMTYTIMSTWFMRYPVPPTKNTRPWETLLLNIFCRLRIFHLAILGEFCPWLFGFSRYLNGGEEKRTGRESGLERGSSAKSNVEEFRYFGWTNESEWDRRRPSYFARSVSGRLQTGPKADPWASTQKYDI